MSLSVKALDHVALHVANVELSIEFYTRVLCLELLPRPAFDFPGAWFRLGTDQELHLIGERGEAVVSGSRSNHFALEVINIADWEAHIKKERAVHRPLKIRPDGATQLFVQDPDGYWIELCAKE